MDPFDYLTKTATETRLIQQTFLQECGQALLDAARAMGECIRAGGKILILGNGGSAADAQHMAAEMVGRMLVEREPLPAIALTTDTSILTAVGNDYGYDAVFRRQVEAIAKKGDVVIAISTSGNSRNVLLAAEAARALGCTIVGLTGGSGGKLKDCCDISLNVSMGTSSSRIQESHIFAIHSLVDILDRFYLKPPRGG